MTGEKLKQFVIQAAEKRESSFEKIIGGFEDRGILNSEMLAVCSVAEELEVEVFIESGRWLGQSTEILARYFESKPVLIESIEAFWDDNAVHVEKKLGGRKNLNLLYGDANTTVPALIRKHRGKKIAILFDGPKGAPALDIFELALAYSDTVVVGFFHDMRRPTEGMPNESRSAMESAFPDSFYTDDDEFVQKFGRLDQGCEVALWRPYFIDGKTIGSYGPTIGLTLPSIEEIRLARRKKASLLMRTWRRFFFLLGIKAYHRLRKMVGL